MIQKKRSYYRFKKISWYWLFLSIITFVLVIFQIKNSYYKGSVGNKDYLEEKMILDQVLLQKTNEKKTFSNHENSKFGFFLDNSISYLVEEKNKNPEAAVLYAIMRYEQGYKIDKSDISLLENQKEQKYKSIYKIYTDQYSSLDNLKTLIEQFNKNDIVSRLISVHIYEKLGQSKKHQQILSIEYWYPLIQMTSTYIFAGFIGLIVLFIYQFQRKKGKYTPEKILNIPDNFEEFNNRGKNAFIISIAIILLPVLLMYFQNILLGCIVTLTLIIFLFSKCQDLWLQSFKGKTNFLSQIKWGLSASLVNIPIMGLFGLLSTILQNFFPKMHHTATDVILTGKDPSKVIVVAFAACIVAPVLEEILFRGIVLPCMIFKYKSYTWGIIITNLVFAAIHPQGIAGWPALFAVGTMASLTYIQTGSILPSIILHMIHNGTLLTMTYVLSLHL